MAKKRFKATKITPRFRRDGHELELTFDDSRGEELKVTVDTDAVHLLTAALVKIVESSKLNMATYASSDGDPDELVEPAPLFHAVEVRGVNWFETGALGLRLWTLERQEIQIQLLQPLAKNLIDRLEIAAKPLRGPSGH